MTVPRAILLACAALALVSGAALEAAGLVVVFVVLAVVWPAGVAQRPVPFRVWWPGGRWSQR